MKEDFKQFSKRYLKEAYGDDESEKRMDLKNTGDIEDIASKNSVDLEVKKDEEVDEVKDAEIEEEVLAIQSQCDSVMKALDVLKKMLGAGPEWALNRVNTFTNDFDKFQNGLINDEKNTKKEGGYIRVKEIEKEAKEETEKDAMKESFKNDSFIKSAVGLVEYTPQAKAPAESFVLDAAKYL